MTDPLLYTHNLGLEILTTSVLNGLPHNLDVYPGLAILYNKRT